MSAETGRSAADTFAELTDCGIEVRTQATIGWSQMAEALASADSYGQAQFFEYLATALSNERWTAGKWAMQCRAICDEPGWGPANRRRIAGILDTLAEHMREDALPGEEADNR